MEDNFEGLISTLQTSPSCDEILCEIRLILEKQNSLLSSAFISQFYRSLLILEHWTWQLFSQPTYEWVQKSNYVELLHTIALFNKNLSFNYEDVEANIKGSLLLPKSTDDINLIFENIEKITDDNDLFIGIVSLWFDNLANILQDNPEFEICPIIIDINLYITRHYIMTDQYKFYLTQLHQLPLSQSIFTAKMLFYIKTCSFYLSSYLFANAQHFIYSPQELMLQLGTDYAEELLTCIVHLLHLFACCSWWGGAKRLHGRIIFSTESEACEYVDALIRIINYKPIHQSVSIRQSNDQTKLLDTTLFSIINIARHQNFIWFLRSKVSLPETLLSISKICVYDRLCLCIYGILGEILDDRSLKTLKISDSASLFFFEILEQAWRNPSKKYKQIPIMFLLNAFVNLSKIDAIQQKTADTNKVSLLIDMCDQYSIVYDILWALSFNHDIQQQLRSNASFMAKLVYLPKVCDDQQIRKITYGLLWNLDTNHTDRQLSLIDNKENFDIMISYSHKDEIICRRIYEQLVDVGWRVWIDFDQMHGNVMDAMAQAIEQSNTIIICMSEEYRKSNYCRAEANYAFQRGTRIVPILLQEHYHPDGWLLFIVSQFIFVDFTRCEFSQAIEILIKELKAPDISEIRVLSVTSDEEVNEINSFVTMSPEPSPSLVLPKDILNWTQTHVQNWLISNSLLQMSRLFANCDGQSLMYMSEMLENLQLQQVISLLQEDSLRRTSQSLSLVEFTYFRSPLNQQKVCLESGTIPKSSKSKRGKLQIKSFACCHIL
ncbi:unnamed protein product [Rotaria socialis]|uniref:TIR domain-containing protein n=2 Tax=Rotaria socialis TaxID=392032 RepID=A0A820XT94_9BILA|nr:unnamed protein product [Rotaria socialis]